LAKILTDIFKKLSSLNVALTSLVLLMILVFLGTLDQVNLGIYAAQRKYFHNIFVYWNPHPGIYLPVFPGGILLTVILIANLLSAMFFTLPFKWKNIGLWVTHLGMILLLFGGGVIGFLAEESRMPIEEGQTSSYSESDYLTEVVLIDRSTKGYDTVISIPEKLLREKKIIRDSRMPFDIKVKAFLENAELSMDKGSKTATRLPVANRGIGPDINVKPLPPVYRDDAFNNATAHVEIADNDKTPGVWLLSRVLAAPQKVFFNGKEYEIYLRAKRHYNGYTLTLKDFQHDIYPGTNIPKNFSSLVELNDPNTGEKRDFKIYMNHPLRYGGKTYYQSSFGKNDTLSILQVVENPGWLLPYISCSLIALGLAIHFLTCLTRFSKGKDAK